MGAEKIIREATVVFPVKGSKVLLARKLKHVGVGALNGFGGEVNPGEDRRAAAIRELKEETGFIADPEDLKKIAEVQIHNATEDGGEWVCPVHFYTLKKWRGTLTIDTEVFHNPGWYSIKKMPVDHMMPADKLFIPQALAGGSCKGEVRYTPKQKALVSAKFYDHVFRRSE